MKTIIVAFDQHNGIGANNDLLWLRDLPADQRAVWRALFEHFIFTDPQISMGHLTPEQRGMLGPPSAKRTREIRAILASAFSRP